NIVTRTFYPRKNESSLCPTFGFRASKLLRIPLLATPVPYSSRPNIVAILNCGYHGSYGGRPRKTGQRHIMRRSANQIRAVTQSHIRLLTYPPALFLALALFFPTASPGQQQKQVPVVIGTQPVASKQYPSPAYEAGKLALADGDYKVA